MAGELSNYYNHLQITRKRCLSTALELQAQLIRLRELMTGETVVVDRGLKDVHRLIKELQK